MGMNSESPENLTTALVHWTKHEIPGHVVGKYADNFLDR